MDWDPGPPLSPAVGRAPHPFEKEKVDISQELVDVSHEKVDVSQMTRRGPLHREACRVLFTGHIPMSVSPMR